MPSSSNLKIWAVAGWAMIMVSSAKNMQLNKLSSVKCLDGSPAAYYIAANHSSKKYVVYLEGGGICQSLVDCKKRSEGPLGSSKGYAATITDTMGGILASDVSNPDFASWNRIFVPYCSGDVWAGTMTEAANPFSSTDTWRAYFSGHSIVSAVVDDIKASYGADAATDVILSGCSAGGIGAFSNCDFFADSFPGARAACRPESGYFGLPIAPYSAWSRGETVSDPMMHHDSDADWLQLISVYQIPAALACNKSTGGGHEFPFCKGIARGCCNKVPYYYPFTKTPIFISQNTMDSYQIAVQGGGSEWNTQYVTYVQETIAGWLTLTAINGPKRGTDGMFTTACFGHCNLEWASGVVINGLHGAEAFSDWYFGRSKQIPSNMHLDNSSSPHCKKAFEDTVVV